MTCTKSQNKLVPKQRVDSKCLESYLVPSFFFFPYLSVMKQPVRKCNQYLSRTKCGVKNLSITCVEVGDIQLWLKSAGNSKISIWFSIFLHIMKTSGLIWYSPPFLSDLTFMFVEDDSNSTTHNYRSYPYGVAHSVILTLIVNLPIWTSNYLERK